MSDLNEIISNNNKISADDMARALVDGAPVLYPKVEKSADNEDMLVFTSGIVGYSDMLIAAPIIEFMGIRGDISRDMFRLRGDGVVMDANGRGLFEISIKKAFGNYFG